MAALPEFTSPTVEAIYAAYVKAGESEHERGHLGASQIGKPCRRQVWYRLRWVNRETFIGRMRRLLETGKQQEARVLGDLRAIGCVAYDVDPTTGRQFNFAIDVGGHFAGSMDGCVLGLPEAPKTWHCLEIKTHSAKSFAYLKAHGVQVAKPEHLAQMQVYMGWSGMERALYFAVNKDNDELYTERVAFDARAFEALRVKARMIVEAAAPPDRYEHPLCDWCSAKDVCRNISLPLVHCRTCLHATPITEGAGAKWVCSRDHHDLVEVMQRRGCEHHLYIPGLLPFAKPVETGDGFIVYQAGETYFVNSTPAAFPACSVPHYRSTDLVKMRIEELGR